MEKVSFFTPVYYSNKTDNKLDRIAQAAERYFYLGGKKAYVIQTYAIESPLVDVPLSINNQIYTVGRKPKLSFQIVEMRDGKSKSLHTALKIASWFTGFVPLFFLVVKALHRTSHQFRVLPQVTKPTQQESQEVEPQVADENQASNEEVIKKDLPVKAEEHMEAPPAQVKKEEAVKKPPLQERGVRPLPKPPEGVIKNGYGEYLVYQRTADGKAEAISEDDYKNIYDLIEECRGKTFPDRHAALTDNIRKKLGREVHLVFVPRTAYELIYLRECVEEELKRKWCCNANASGVELALSTDNEKLLQQSLKKARWQQCSFNDEDYLLQFKDPYKLKYRKESVKVIAATLNQVALSRFATLSAKPVEGLTFDEIKATAQEDIEFFKELHGEESKNRFFLNTNGEKIDIVNVLRNRPFSNTPSITESFITEDTKVWGKAERFPLGISEERHESIVKQAIQMECCAEAVNHLVLYRGAEIDKDAIIRKEFEFSNRGLMFPNSLVYGASLYAGAIYDGGVTAFHFMRSQWVDAQAVFVPLKEQQEGTTPFHVQQVHPLIQLMSKGEIFNARTKIWPMNPDDKVLGFLGIAKCNFKEIADCCKTTTTQAKMEEEFKKYKENTYLLAKRQESK